MKGLEQPRILGWIVSKHIADALGKVMAKHDE